MLALLFTKDLDDYVMKLDTSDAVQKESVKTSLLIFNTCSRRIRSGIKPFTTPPKTIWDSLKSRYEVSGLISRENMMTKWMELRYNNSEKFENFCHKWDKAYNNAKDTGYGILQGSDETSALKEFRSHVLLRALGDHFPYYVESCYQKLRDGIALDPTKMKSDIIYTIN
ncbi:hypothetical protein EV356DRAFT_501816 [Viridothelium virens]|uniref:Uncharacterized protein n=1 Tax=Viridothelium virens TaxID=1048519 RepID=A0A6A6H846_VIRVR|nr:hypothetical protein EV356DRAFT_501816 [Viridothelium virens]